MHSKGTPILLLIVPLMALPTDAAVVRYDILKISQCNYLQADETQHNAYRHPEMEFRFCCLCPRGTKFVGDCNLKEPKSTQCSPCSYDSHVDFEPHRESECTRKYHRGYCPAPKVYSRGSTTEADGCVCPDGMVEDDTTRNCVESNFKREVSASNTPIQRGKYTATTTTTTTTTTTRTTTPPYMIPSIQAPNDQNSQFASLIDFTSNTHAIKRASAELSDENQNSKYAIDVGEYGHGQDLSHSATNSSAELPAIYVGIGLLSTLILLALVIAFTKKKTDERKVSSNIFEGSSTDGSTVTENFELIHEETPQPAENELRSSLTGDDVTRTPSVAWKISSDSRSDDASHTFHDMQLDQQEGVNISRVNGGRRTPLEEHICFDAHVNPRSNDETKMGIRQVNDDCSTSSPNEHCTADRDVSGRTLSQTDEPEVNLSTILQKAKEIPPSKHKEFALNVASRLGKICASKDVAQMFRTFLGHEDANVIDDIMKNETSTSTRIHELMKHTIRRKGTLLNPSYLLRWIDRLGYREYTEVVIDVIEDEFQLSDYSNERNR